MLPFEQGEDKPCFFISPNKVTNDEELAQKLQPNYHK